MILKQRVGVSLANYLFLLICIPALPALVADPDFLLLAILLMGEILIFFWARKNSKCPAARVTEEHVLVYFFAWYTPAILKIDKIRTIKKLSLTKVAVQVEGHAPIKISSQASSITAFLSQMKKRGISIL